MYFVVIAFVISLVYSQKTVVDVINSRPELSTLASALKSAGLDTVLSDKTQNFTIFAPNNTAFAGVVVPNSIPVLQNLLEYHVVSGYILSTDLSSGEVAPTLIKQTVTVEIHDNHVNIFDSMGRRARVFTADLTADNGVVHIVGSVLLPNGTIADITSNIEDLSSLNGALEATGLNKTLADPTQSLTLFAPTNKAVSAFTGTIDTNVLLYHVLGAEVFSTDLKMGDNAVPTLDSNKDVLDVIANATGVFVKDVENREGQVVVANVAGVNGVVHVIDIVLSPVAV
jgi:transforming growth factor-beta-induced protein